MSADWETANENRLEWAEEKRRGLDIELKIEHNVVGRELKCDWPRCPLMAVRECQIGKVHESWSVSVCLCAEHDCDENAFEVYRDTVDDAPELEDL